MSCVLKSILLLFMSKCEMYFNFDGNTKMLLCVKCLQLKSIMASIKQLIKYDV